MTQGHIWIFQTLVLGKSQFGFQRSIGWSDVNNSRGGKVRFVLLTWKVIGQALAEPAVEIIKTLC